MTKYFCYFQIHRTSFLGVDVKKRSKRTIFQIRIFLLKALLLLSFLYCNCSFIYGGSIAFFCLHPKVKGKPWEKYLNQKTTGSINAFFSRRDRFKLFAFQQQVGNTFTCFESILLSGGANLPLPTFISDLKHSLSIHISLKNQQVQL